MPPAVSIIGASGALGFGLAVRWGRAGVPVVIGSRDPDRAREAARRAQDAVPDGSFSGAANAEAAAETEIVVLTVPFRSQSETLTNLKAVLRPGQLLVDTTVPLAAAVAGRATPDRVNAGQGLRNLHDRLASIGGGCHVTSQPGRGTQVALEVELR